MLLSPRKKRLTSLFKEIRVFKEYAPLRGSPFRVMFCLLCPGGGKQWIHPWDPVEVVLEFPEKQRGFRHRKRANSPFGKRRGGQGNTNGNHKLVHVWFSLTLSTGNPLINLVRRSEATLAGQNASLILSVSPGKCSISFQNRLTN